MDGPTTLHSPSPRLRIHHLVLIMTAMAFVATWRLALNDKLAEIPAKYRSSNTPSDILRISLAQIICYGGMLAVVLASSVWKARHRTTPWQPGQWLSLLGTIVLLHELAFTLPRFVDWFGPVIDGRSQTMPVRREFAFYLLCAIFIAYASWSIDCGFFWRLSLVALAVHLLVSSLSNGMFIWAGWFRWDNASVNQSMIAFIRIWHFAWRTALVAVTLTAVADLLRKSRMTWTHWAGVVLWLSLAWSSEIALILEFGFF
jgi:hypothetical protein